MIRNILFSDNEIYEKRLKVYKEFINISPNVKSGVITKISEHDLYLLFNLYDSIFLNNYFKENLRGKLNFSLSTKMTSCAGKTIYPKNLEDINNEDVKFEIRMGVNFFFKYYETNVDKIVNGIKTKDALEAFLLVFEHEICHLIELIEFSSSSCKKEGFKRIAKNIFGHRDVYHALPSNKQIADMKYGFKIGDRVSFIFEGKRYNGFINNINKRATVMVLNNNGNYVDKKGNRYAKYYVPLSELKIQ